MDKQTTKLEHFTALSDQTLEQIQGGGGWWDWFQKNKKKNLKPPYITELPNFTLA